MAVFHMASPCRSKFIYPRLEWGNTFSLWRSVPCCSQQSVPCWIVRGSSWAGTQVWGKSSLKGKAVSSGNPLALLLQWSAQVWYCVDQTFSLRFCGFIWRKMAYKGALSPPESPCTVAFSTCSFLAIFFLWFLSFYQDAAFYRFMCLWAKNRFVNKFA